MWFAYILTVLFIITGFFWFLDKLVLAPQRRRNAQAIKNQMKGGYNEAVANALQRPHWLEYTAGLFGVVALVFVLRSFVTEPFRIPSSSMLPTLLEGDFILVNKHNYGLRMPISNNVIVPVGSPQRGDVVVFRYPLDPSTDYIKRLVGLPGDEIKYEGRQLTINGEVIVQRDNQVRQLQSGTYDNRINLKQIKQSSEFLVNKSSSHEIWYDPTRQVYDPRLVYPHMKESQQFCTYHETGFSCKVPQGQYFMMGDDRDYSEDSRYWGFVPEDNVIGRAYWVWMNFQDMSRIGTSIQ